MERGGAGKAVRVLADFCADCGAGAESAQGVAGGAAAQEGGEMGAEEDGGEGGAQEAHGAYVQG